MFYLEANNAQGEKISLYIQGIRLNGQLGICDGQKIFKLNKIYPELTHRILPDQIGITERINGKLFFNFTDAPPVTIRWFKDFFQQSHCIPVTLLFYDRPEIVQNRCSILRD